MAFITQNAGDQQRRAVAGSLHVHVVVELESEDVHIAKTVDEIELPDAQVRGISEGVALAEEVRRAFEAKTAGGPTIVGHGKGPATNLAAVYFLSGLVEPNQMLVAQLAECLALSR